MSPGQRADPYLAFRFLVEIEGLVVGGFSDVSGLQIETVVDTFREGGLNEYEHKLPGPTRYPSNLVLKHGLTDAHALWDWHQETVQGTITRRNGSIVLLDYEGNETWRWNFVQAYPIKWSGPDFRAENAAVAIETLELVHHGISKGT